MSNNNCCQFAFEGGTCHLTASVRITYTFSSAWAPPLRDATDSRDLCSLHSRVMMAHFRSHSPSHWTSVKATLLSALPELSDR